MKKVLFISALVLSSVFGLSSFQDSERKSPGQIAEGEIDGVDIAIEYSSPAVKERKIWGELVPYNKVWRTGANENTTIEFSDAVSIGGVSVKAGKYSLFTEPGESEWKVFINSVHDGWGTSKYDVKNNVAEFTVTPVSEEEIYENLLFEIGEEHIHMRWERLHLKIPVKSL